MATLLSLAAQDYLDAQAGGGPQATAAGDAAAAQAAAAPAASGGPQGAVVSALLVAPPNAGSPAFVEAFNRRVNARRLAAEYDIVPQVGGQL